MIVTTCKMQVTCTIKTSHQSHNERISYIGGYGWLFTQQQAVHAIFNQQYTFYVRIENRTADIIIASYQGYPYLKTVLDREQPEQLLCLPDFDEKGVLLNQKQNEIFLESLAEAEAELRILAR
jgi:Protein of unknown function (DUF3892)